MLLLGGGPAAGRSHLRGRGCTPVQDNQTCLYPFRRIIMHPCAQVGKRAAFWGASASRQEIRTPDGPLKPVTAHTESHFGIDFQFLDDIWTSFVFFFLSGVKV